MPWGAVPCAPPEAEPIVCDLCERLRNDQRYQEQYLERAEAIEAELNLPAVCADIEDLGQPKHLPLRGKNLSDPGSTGALLTVNSTFLGELLLRHSQSIWRTKGENQEQWSLIQAALTLIRNL